MQTKDLTQRLNGGLDTRSADGACGQGWFRLLANVNGSEQWEMCSLGGWRRRLYTATCTNNADLHDQLAEASWYSNPYDVTSPAYSIQTGTAYGDIPIYQSFPEETTELCAGLYYLNRTCREAVTFLKSVTSISGHRRLLAGTHSRLYVSDDSGGNWRIIADGLGGACTPEDLCTCSPIRMMGATLGNYTVLTNDTDEVLYWQFDTGPGGCYGWSADYIQELRYLNLTRAAGVVEFEGIIFLWDVRMDNQEHPDRLIWNDFNAPLSWIPGGESIAGFKSFGRGEKIIACVPISGRLRVYTTQAIYDGTIVQDERVIAFVEKYRLSGGVTSNLPAFRHGIANCGSFHVYVGQDDVFLMAVYDTEPQAMDWLHRASGVIFDGIPENWVCGSDISSQDAINRNACDQLTARWSGRQQCVIISWATGDEICPNLSLWLWPGTRKATVVDYGFTEIAEHQPDTSINWRDFFGLHGVCDPADFLLDKEGESCPVTYVEQEYVGIWNATEDPDLPMDPNSVAAIFCDICLADLCKLCEADTALVLASASDKTLKEYTPDQYIREELIDQTDATFPEPNLGEYVENSYSVLIQSDADQYDGPQDKTIRAMMVGYTAGSSNPGTLCAQVGGGFSPGCLEWETSHPIVMECGRVDPRKRQGEPARFGFMTTGIWLAWRLSTSATDFCAININYKIEPDGCW